MSKLITIMSLIILHTISSLAEYAKGDLFYFLDDKQIWSVTGVTSEFVKIDGPAFYNFEKKMTHKEAREKLIPIVSEITSSLGRIQTGHYVKATDDKFYKVRAILKNQQLWLKDATDMSNYDIRNELMYVSDVAFTSIDCIENTDYCNESKIDYDGITWRIVAISSDGTALIYHGVDLLTSDFIQIELLDNIEKGYVRLL